MDFIIFVQTVPLEIQRFSDSFRKTVYYNW